MLFYIAKDCTSRAAQKPRRRSCRSRASSAEGQPYLWISRRLPRSFSSVCRRVANPFSQRASRLKTGMVHLKMNKIVQEFVDVDSCEAVKLRRLIKKEGRGLDDDTLVNLLTKRMMFEDCQTNGFIIEDFPRTRGQAQALAKKGFCPHICLPSQSSS